MAIHHKKPSQITKLIEYSREDTTNTYKDINFGQVPNYKAQEINLKTGIKINGAMKILSNQAIIHIFSNHGHDKKEGERGQKGVTDADCELIPSILSDYDDVFYGGKNSKGKESIVFVKVINNLKYHVAMAVSPSKDQINLFVNTMYIKK
jgi:hypothetical protein